MNRSELLYAAEIFIDVIIETHSMKLDEKLKLSEAAYLLNLERDFIELDAEIVHSWNSILRNDINNLISIREDLEPLRASRIDEFIWKYRPKRPELHN